MENRSLEHPFPIPAPGTQYVVPSSNHKIMFFARRSLVLSLLAKEVCLNPKMRWKNTATLFLVCIRRSDASNIILLKTTSKQTDEHFFY